MTFATKNMKLRGRQFASACSKKHQRHSEHYTLPTLDTDQMAYTSDLTSHEALKTFTLFMLDSLFAQQSHVELRLFLQHISAWLERICCIIALLSHYPDVKFQHPSASVTAQGRWCLEYGKGIERRHVWEEANKPNLVQSCSAISCGTSIVSSTHLSLAGANLLHHSTTESLPRCQISTPIRKCDSTGTLMLGIWERNRKEACVRRSKQAKFGPVLLSNLMWNFDCFFNTSQLGWSEFVAS